jgi:transcriptional regulator of heat shock response
VLSQDHDLDLSPASIRNVMADLEAAGLLMQPHTSAGRVPTDKGYRYWVDALMEPEELPEREKELIWNELHRERTVAGLVEKVSKIISELTENAAMIYLKNLKRASFLSQLIDELVAGRRIEEFLEEEPELFIDGAFRMFGHPEFQDLEKMRHLLQAFDEKVAFLDILVRDLESEGIHVHIGSENVAGRLGNVSLVVKDCYFGNMPIGGVAVVGPTRMRYSKAVSVVGFVADSLTDAMKKF